jgi:hypothetical protein
MKTTLGVLIGATIVGGLILGCASETTLLLPGLLLAIGALALASLAWQGQFWALVLAAPLSAALLGLACAQFLELAWGWPGPMAAALGLIVGVALLSLTIQIWERGINVLPIEVLVLRDHNTQRYTLVTGPARVGSLPYRAPFARLPLLPQEFTQRVQAVDLLLRGERGAAASQRIEHIEVEVCVQLDRDHAFDIVFAPSWTEYLGEANQLYDRPCSFAELLLDHKAWLGVIRSVTRQQLELVLRRVACATDLYPHQLSAGRDQFAAAVEQDLAKALGHYGIALTGFDVLRVEWPEARAAADALVRSRQIEGAIALLRRLGLPETIEHIELIVRQITGSAESPSTLRLRQLPGPAEEPLQSREVGR